MSRMTRWLTGAVAVCVLAGTAMTTRIAFAQETKKGCPVSKALAATPITLTATLRQG